MITKEQKIEIVKSRINIIEGVLYNLDLSIIEEESKTQPNSEYISQLSFEKSENLLSLAAMNNKLNLVLAE
jgi:hypothetical protein